MAHVCPWWFVRSFDNPIRRRFHDPEQMFGELVRPGMQVLDVGCGAGFNTEGLARLVGPDGLVAAVDLQPRMLEMTKLLCSSRSPSFMSASIPSTPAWGPRFARDSRSAIDPQSR